MSDRFSQLCAAVGLKRPAPNTIAMLNEQMARADADAKVRAEAIVEGVDAQHAEALAYMIQCAIMQFYQRGAIDALDRQKALLKVLG